MAFLTVGDLITQVRVLVQDTDVALQRYTDATLVQALNSGLLDARRVRPDLYRSTTGMVDVPQYATTDMATALAFEPMFIPTLVYYVAGLAQLRDAEEATDARATQLLLAFGKELTGVP